VADIAKVSVGREAYCTRRVPAFLRGVGFARVQA
jgi:hypothetical protein